MSTNVINFSTHKHKYKNLPPECVRSAINSDPVFHICEKCKQKYSVTQQRPAWISSDNCQQKHNKINNQQTHQSSLTVRRYSTAQLYVQSLLCNLSTEIGESIRERKNRRGVVQHSLCKSTKNIKCRGN